MSFVYKRSGSTNAEPICIKLKLKASEVVQLNQVIGVDATGVATAKASAAGKFAGVIKRIFVQFTGGEQTIPGSSFSGLNYTAPADNASRGDASWVEVIVDTNAQFEADWDTTPSVNSLLTGGQANINTTGLTLANATSTAPLGAAANVVIISTNATTSKSLVKFNPSSSLFNS